MSKPRYLVQAYLSANEFSEFEKAFATSSSPSRASYARKLLLGQPVRTYYRDRAFDAFIEASVQFNKDLKSLLSAGWGNTEESASLLTLAQEIKLLLIKIDDYVRENRSNMQPPKNA